MSTETEAQVEQPVPVVVNKEAFRELKAQIGELVEKVDVLQNKYSGVGSSKLEAKVAERFGIVAKRVAKLVVKAVEVRDLLNDRTRKLNGAKEQVKELTQRVADLQEIVDNEPIKHPLQFRRMYGVFTHVSPDMPEEIIPVDTFDVDSDPIALATRLFPIVNPNAGVIGLRVFGDDRIGHNFMFDSFISLVGLRIGRELDVSNEGDATLVYREAVSLAVSVADAYTRLYGPFRVIDSIDRVNAESPSHVFIDGENLGAPLGQVSTNGLSQSEVAPTEEELERRRALSLGGADDSDDSDDDEPSDDEDGEDASADLETEDDSDDSDDDVEEA